MMLRSLLEKELRALRIPSSGGSMIMGKVYEPLQATIQAYNDQITQLTKLPKKLQEYPNKRAKKIAFDTFYMKKFQLNSAGLICG